MNTISYLIVEDEMKSRQTLLKKIDMCNLPKLVCIGLASDSEEALWLVKKTHPDIILLDINLPGKNGFEFLETIKEVNCDPEIIFTSAHTENEHLLRALKNGPVNYLIKPIDIDELAASFEKAFARVLLKKNQFAASGKIRFNGSKEVLYLKPEQIAYCQADGAYSRIFFTNGKIELISQPISLIEKELPSSVFLRIDRSNLINLNLVESVDMKNQTCVLRELNFVLKVEASLIGLKRLMTRLEQK